MPVTRLSAVPTSPDGKGEYRLSMPSIYFAVSRLPSAKA